MRDRVPIDTLAAGLELGEHELVSLVGGGGKTTVLFALGRQLAGSRILTTTTKMGTDRTLGHVPLIAPTDAEILASVSDDRSALVWSEAVGHRAEGVAPEDCDRWFEMVDHVIVEADGSRRRPFKAPAAHEPVVPDRTTVLLACVGAGAFDGVIGDVCHRPELVAEVAGCGPRDRLTAPRLAAVLEAPEGSQKNCPDGARVVILANQVTNTDRRYVEDLANRLSPSTDLIVVEKT